MTTLSTATMSHQQQLAHLQDEVQALREELRRAQRLATVGTMTAMVAHEFNNILTPIINYAQLAQKNPALTDKAITKAADGGKRASDICKAILGMTRSSAAPEEVNVAQLMEQTLSAMAREPAKDGIDLTINVPADLTVVTRSVELQQVLLNLLINARAAIMEKASRPRRMEISASTTGQDAIISISDTGVGIAPENLQKIFQPFFTTKAQGGHGLGLTICKEIIASLGGQISVSSVAGEGSCFTISLPIKPAGVR